MRDEKRAPRGARRSRGRRGARAASAINPRRRQSRRVVRRPPLERNEDVAAGQVGAARTPRGARARKGGARAVHDAAWRGGVHSTRRRAAVLALARRRARCDALPRDGGRRAGAACLGVRRRYVSVGLREAARSRAVAPRTRVGRRDRLEAARRRMGRAADASTAAPPRHRHPSEIARRLRRSARGISTWHPAAGP